MEAMEKLGLFSRATNGGKSVENLRWMAPTANMNNHFTSVVYGWNQFCMYNLDEHHTQPADPLEGAALSVGRFFFVRGKVACSLNGVDTICGK